MFKVNILQGWLGVENEGVFNENAISEIEKNAKEGDEDAKIKLAALNAEKGENFEENFSFLETLHAEGNEYETAKENKNEDWQNMAKTWLSSLYEVKGSPVYDLEKANYWKEKE